MEEKGMRFHRSQVNLLPFESADSSSARLYALPAPALFGYVRLYIASREVAEDLVIDVFLSALEHSYLLARSTETQRAWLRKSAYYKIMECCLPGVYLELCCKHIFLLVSYALSLVY